MEFCLPHRVSLVLAVEGIPVSWASLRIPSPSVACPLCQAYTSGDEAMQKAVSHWVKVGRNNSAILVQSSKDSDKHSDKKERDMDYKTQRTNAAKDREERNKKIINKLTNGGTNTATKRSNKPTKKPNHLRLV